MFRFSKEVLSGEMVGKCGSRHKSCRSLPHVKKYMESVKKLPITVTCRNVAKACDDSLMTAKLSFSSSVATMFEPFLRKFQTAEPMAVFLYEEMANLLRSVLKLA